MPSMSLRNSGAGLDQHRLALGVRLARHRRAAPAGSARSRRPRRAPRAFGSRATKSVLTREQLHQVVDAPELDDALVDAAAGHGHRAAEEAGLADAARQILGDRKNGLLKSSGLSSIQTLSSFCQSAIRPSICLASLITVANAGGWPAAARRRCGGGRRAGARRRAQRGAAGAAARRRRAGAAAARRRQPPSWRAPPWRRSTAQECRRSCKRRRDRDGAWCPARCIERRDYRSGMSTAMGSPGGRLSRRWPWFRQRRRRSATAA